VRTVQYRVDHSCRMGGDFGERRMERKCHGPEHSEGCLIGSPRSKARSGYGTGAYRHAYTLGRWKARLQARTRCASSLSRTVC
jgi:hypothetical protein